MANLLILGRALDANGYVMPGGKATVYAAGTSTLIPVYSDPAGTIAAANPIVADGNGFWPQRYVSEAPKAVITDANDVSVETFDPAPTTLGIGAAAGEVSFNPTVAVPFNNVQAAVEGVAASVVSGVSAFGIGITGNAPLLANLDATTLAAGVYRFDGTTTGTYPTGVTAANTGLVEMWRMTGSAGQMELLEITTNRRFRRRMTGSVWQIWREDTAVSQGSARGDVIRRGASDWERLALGAANTVLTSNGTDAVWSLSGVAARVNWNGVPANGTYSRTGNLVTITITGHGMSTGHFASLDFTSGGATDGYYEVTVLNANTFTVTDSASGTTSGNVTRGTHVRSSFNVSNVERTGVGDYTITFTTPFPNDSYTAIGMTRGAASHPVQSMAISETNVPTASQLFVSTGRTGGVGATGQRDDVSRNNLVVFA